MAARQLDLVFLVDTTGSMGSYLRAAQDNIKNIYKTITESEKVDLRVSIVEYKDHEQGSEFPFLYHDWMTDIKAIQKACDEMQATGGGDGPESIACALDCAVNTLEYRELAAKVIIWIADAPPHGFGDAGDFFPNGCPCKKDFQQQVLKAMENDIQIYSVAIQTFERFDESSCTDDRGTFCSIEECRFIGENNHCGINGRSWNDKYDASCTGKIGR